MYKCTQQVIAKYTAAGQIPTIQCIFRCHHAYGCCDPYQTQFETANAMQILHRQTNGMDNVNITQWDWIQSLSLQLCEMVSWMITYSILYKLRDCMPALV